MCQQVRKKILQKQWNVVGKILVFIMFNKKFCPPQKINGNVRAFYFEINK